MFYDCFVGFSENFLNHAEMMLFMHEDIVKKLEEKFPGAEVEVVDTSAGHESHNALYNIMVSKASH